MPPLLCGATVIPTPKPEAVFQGGHRRVPRGGRRQAGAGPGGRGRFDTHRPTPSVTHGARTGQDRKYTVTSADRHKHLTSSSVLS